MRLIDADALLQVLVDNGWLKMDFLKDSVEMVAVQSAIDAAPTIVPPTNNPLTLSELREMNGEPVWVKSIDNTKKDGWAFVNVACEMVSREGHIDVSLMRNFWSYGSRWLAYLRKPE